MLRPSIRRVFRSRWSALWWSACVLLSAWEVSTASENGLPGLGGGAKPTSDAQSGQDPWAIDSR